jgi:hypothetical protein
MTFKEQIKKEFPTIPQPKAYELTLIMHQNEKKFYQQKSNWHFVMLYAILTHQHHPELIRFRQELETYGRIYNTSFAP